MKVIKALAGGALVLCVFLIPRVVSRASWDKPKCNCYFPNLGKYGVAKSDHCEVVECEPPKPKPTATPTPTP